MPTLFKPAWFILLAALGICLSVCAMSLPKEVVVISISWTLIVSYVLLREMDPMIVNYVQPVNLKRVPEKCLIGIMQKMRPGGFVRLRMTCKFMDTFAETHRKDISILHNSVLYFNGEPALNVVVKINKREMEHFRPVDDPARMLSGFSFKGIVFNDDVLSEQTQEIFDILEDRKNRFVGMKNAECTSLKNIENVLRLIRPRILTLNSICDHSVDLFEDLGTEVLQIAVTRLPYCPPSSNFYQFAMNFRLVHAFFPFSKLSSFINQWIGDLQPRKLEWLKVEEEYLKLFKMEQFVRICNFALASIPHRIEFAKIIKFLDFETERETVCVSITREDGKQALLAMSQNVPEDPSESVMATVDFIPGFEGDFQAFSVKNNYYPSVWKENQFVCRLSC